MDIIFRFINKFSFFDKKVKIAFFAMIFILSLGLTFFINQLFGPLSLIIFLLSALFIFLLAIEFLLLVFPVKCNICGWRGRRFYDNDCGYGHIYKKSTCLGCFSQPRHRAFVFYFKKIVPKDKPLKLLHFAPEPFVAKFLQSYQALDYLSVDIDQDKAMKKEDITNLSFGDSSFDIIICSHVLEHVINDNKAMRELFRILKPGGFAIIDVPIDYSRAETYEDFNITSPEKRTEVFWQFDHLRLYGRDFPDKLRQAGFKVTVDHFISSLSYWKKKHFGLLDEPTYFCEKKDS
jgi:SAM-dependent methyltransferase